MRIMERDASMRKAISISVLAGLCLAVGASWAPAATMTFNSAADGEILPGAPYNTHNRGLATDMFIGFAGAGNGRVLLRFNISAIPSGQTITSATLTLTQAGATNSNLSTSAYRLLTPWVEGNGTGYPAAGTTGATWFDTDKSVPTSWSVAGANDPGVDREAAASFTVTPTGGFLTANATADVAAWYAGTPNYGWVFAANTATNPNADRYWTNNSASPPQLAVTFVAVPEPASLGLVVLAAGCFMLRRRPPSRNGLP